MKSRLKKLKLWLITKDQQLFWVFFFSILFSSVVISSLNHSTIQKFNEEEIIDYASFDKVADNFNASLLREKVNETDLLWNDEVNFPSFLMHNYNIYVNNTQMIESIGSMGLFLDDDSANKSIEFLTQTHSIDLEGRFPVSQNEIIIDRETSLFLSDYYNTSEIISNSFNFTFYLHTPPINFTMELIVCGICDFNFESKYLDRIFQIDKEFYTWNDILLKWSLRHFNYQLDIVNNHFIMGNMNLGSLLYSQIFNEKYPYHFFYKINIFKNITSNSTNNFQNIIQNNILSSTINELNKNNIDNRYPWESAESSLTIFNNNIQQLNILLQIITSISVSIGCFLFAFHYWQLKQLTLEKTKEFINQLITTGFSYKKIQNIFAKNDMIPINKSIIYSFLAGMGAEFFITLLFQDLITIDSFSIIFSYFLSLFILQNLVLFSINRFCINNILKGLYDSSLFVDNTAEVFDKNSTSNNPDFKQYKQNRHIIRRSYRFLTYLSLIISIMIPFFLDNDMLARNGLIFDFYPPLADFFPIEWAMIMALYPDILIILYLLFPILILRFIYPYLKHLFLRVNLRKLGVIKTRDYLKKIFIHEKDTKTSYFFITVFCLSIIISIFNLNSLVIEHDKRELKENFGPDIICYERTYSQYSYDMEINYTTLKQNLDGISHTCQIIDYIFDYNFYNNRFYCSILNFTDYFSTINKLQISLIQSMNMQEKEILFNALNQNASDILISHKFSVINNLETGQKVNFSIPYYEDGHIYHRIENYTVAGILRYAPGIDLDKTSVLFHNNVSYSLEVLDMNRFFFPTSKRYFMKYNLNSTVSVNEIVDDLELKYMFQFPIIQFYSYIQSKSILFFEFTSWVLLTFLFILLATQIALMKREDIQQQSNIEQLISIGLSRKSTYRYYFKIKIKSIAEIFTISSVLVIFMSYFTYKIQDIFYLYDFGFGLPFGPVAGSYNGGHILPFSVGLQFQFSISYYVIIILLIILLLNIVYISIKWKQELNKGLENHTLNSKSYLKRIINLREH